LIPCYLSSVVDDRSYSGGIELFAATSTENKQLLIETTPIFFFVDLKFSKTYSIDSLFSIHSGR